MDGQPGEQLNMQYSQPQHQDAAMLTVRLDTSPELLQLELFFRGMKIDANGDMIPVFAGAKPLMNDAGVFRLMGILTAHASKVTYLSNTTKEEIDELTLDSSFAIIFFLGFDYYKYDIAKDDRDLIKVACNNFIYLAAKRPMNDKEREHLGTQYQVRETHTLNPGAAQSKMPVFSAFGGN